MKDPATKCIEDRDAAIKALRDVLALLDRLKRNLPLVINYLTIEDVIRLIEIRKISGEFPLPGEKSGG